MWESAHSPFYILNQLKSKTRVNIIPNDACFWIVDYFDKVICRIYTSNWDTYQNYYLDKINLIFLWQEFAEHWKKFASWN